MPVPDADHPYAPPFDGTDGFPVLTCAITRAPCEAESNVLRVQSERVRAALRAFRAMCAPCSCVACTAARGGK